MLRIQHFWYRQAQPTRAAAIRTLIDAALTANEAVYAATDPEGARKAAEALRAARLREVENLGLHVSKKAREEALKTRAALLAGAADRFVDPARPATKYYDECPPCEGMNHDACWHGKPHPNDPAVTVQCGCSCGVLSPSVK